VSWCRVPRLAAFALMLAGASSTFCGCAAEDSLVRSPGVFDGGLSSDDSARIRSRACAFKNAGAAMVLAGPVVWLLGNLLVRGDGGGQQ
jgi:hypothetical protein